MEEEKLIEKIYSTQTIEKDELEYILKSDDQDFIQSLFHKARQVGDKIYGNKIYIRGLIEFSNICKNDCLYCGIRKSNTSAQRYRLTEEEIMYCVNEGYELGYRTFVLQGGEDMYYTDDMYCHILQQIKSAHPDCAITLSIGERTRESYQRYHEAGADRFLLRHETADQVHYESLHPENMSFEHRMNCLHDLKEIGYQVGCGFMVGSPNQTIDTLYQDLMFIKEFQPHMVGIGPFIPASGTPFENEKAGTLNDTLKLLSIIRLIHPHVLLPATTALGTIHPRGREMGILAGANVVMPNLSPVGVRKMYSLYDNKICTGEESAQCIRCMDRRMNHIGYEIVKDRGDYKK